MRVILILLMLVSFVAAASELKTYAKIFPKILAYDYNLKDKLYGQTIHLGILYDEHSHEEAKQLGELIRLYNPEINGFGLRVLLVHSAQFTRTPPAVSALLIMGEPADQDIYRQVREFAVHKSIIVFALRMEDVREYATIGLFFGKSIRPIINKQLMIESGIRLKTTFLKFAKVYDDE